MKHKRLKIALIVLAALCVAGASITPLIVQQIRTSKKGRVVEGDTFNIVVTNDGQIGNSLAANGKTRANFIAYHNGKVVRPEKWTLINGDDLPSPLIFEGQAKSSVASVYIDNNNPNAYIWETKIWIVEAEYKTEAGEVLTAQGKVKILRSDITNNYGILCLQNGVNISIPDIATFNSLCVAGPSNTVISLAGQTFQKKDITHFQFGSAYSDTRIVPEFMSNCINFNNELILPSSVTEVGNNFLLNCSLFNSNLNIDNLTTIGDNFMNECVKFNRNLTFSPILSEIKNNFLKGCYDYNLPISFPASVQSIGNGFLEGCASFNQNLILPDTITNSIGTRFLYKCDSMTSKVTINVPPYTSFLSDPYSFATDNPSADSFVKGMTIQGPFNNEYCDFVFTNNASTPYRNLLSPINGIGRVTFSDGKKLDIQDDGTNPTNPNTNYYAEFTNYYCGSGNSIYSYGSDTGYTRGDVVKIEFSEQFNLATTPRGFLRGFMGLTTEEVIIPDCVEVLGREFMLDCQNYNAPLNLPYRLRSIDTDFMKHGYSFNSPLTIPNSVTWIGSWFLISCGSFNQPLVLPNTLTAINDHFLYGNGSFNNTITFPQGTLTSIGANFMENCAAFNQPLTLPGTVTWIGANFFMNCNSFTSTIDFQNIASTALVTSGNNFATGDDTAASCNTGITLKGNNVDKIINAHPNMLPGGSGPFRKLNNAITDVIGVARLTLNDGRIVHVPADEFNKLSNHGDTNPATTGPTINGISFNWDQLIGLEFTPEFNFDKIPSSFLRNCTSFNQPITLPTCVKEIGEAFLMGATSYDTPIDFPEVEIIGPYFLASYTTMSFNSTISFPKLKTLGWRFLYNATNYNKDLVLPMTLEEIGTWFMYGTKSMTSAVNFGNLDPSVLLGSQENFATNDSTAASYTTGITIQGTTTTVEGIIADNENYNINPFRKLHDDNVADCYAELTLNDGSTRKIYNLADFETWLSGPTNAGNPGDWMYINQGTGPLDYPAGGWPTGGPYSTEPLSQPYVRGDVTGFRFGKYASEGSPTGDAPISAIIDNFMYNYNSLNSTIILPETVTTIGGNFLLGCARQNSPIVIPNNVTSIGGNFVHTNVAFNSYINIPTSLTAIPDYFFYGNISFDQPINISNINTIGNHFMDDCRNFNKKLTFSSGLTSLGNTFLSSSGNGTYGCVAFNQPLDFSSTGLTSIGTQFIDSNTSAAFNSEIKFPNTVTSIGQWFLNDANHYNQPFDVPTGIDGSSGKKIGSNFMEGLDAMISEVKFSTLVNSDNVLNQRGAGSPCFTTYSAQTNAFQIGIALSGTIDPVKLYMNNPYRNNGVYRKVRQPPVPANVIARVEYNNGESIIDITTTTEYDKLGGTAMVAPTTTDLVINGVSIPRSDITAVRVYKEDYTPSWFMYNCINLKTVELAPTMRIARDHFLQSCTSFNSQIVNLDKITETQEGFLYGSSSYNQATTFGSGLATVGNYFMSSMANFNQPINFTSTAVTEINDIFLTHNPAFNSSVSLKSTTTKIGNQFLYDDVVFNTQISIPDSVTTIADLFLGGDVSFNQPITMPASLTKIYGGSFMRHMLNMTSLIQFRNTPANVFDVPGSNWHLSVDSSNAEAYKQGLYLTGTNSAQYKANLYELTAQSGQNGRWRRWRSVNFIYVTASNGTAGNINPADVATLTNGNVVIMDSGSTAPAYQMRTISFGEDFNLVSIPNNFMRYWANTGASFASAVRLPHCVRNIGDYFMANLMWVNSRGDHLVSYPEYKIGDANITIGKYQLNGVNAHTSLFINISSTRSDVEIPNNAIFIDQDFICLANGRSNTVYVYMPWAATGAYTGGNSSLGWFYNGRDYNSRFYSFQMYGTTGGTGPASAGVNTIRAYFSHYYNRANEWENNGLYMNNPNRRWYLFDNITDGDLWNPYQPF